MKKFLGLTLLACALLGLVSLNVEMKGRIAGMNAAEKIPFALGILLGAAVFVVPAYFLLRSTGPRGDGDEAEESDWPGE